MKVARGLVGWISVAPWLLYGSVAAQPSTAPTIHPGNLESVASGVWVIPDQRVDFVPNVGIIEGTEAVLVVDTGLGARNGYRVYETAKKLAQGRRIYVTTTHFHPEHSFGASAFPRQSFLMNEAQAEELREKGARYLALFRGLSDGARVALEGVKLARPALTYSGSLRLDLGGREVQLWTMAAHTRGDQVIWVPDSAVLFTGDLVENRYFPVTPDSDSHGDKWIAAINRMMALHPKIVVPGHGAVGEPALLATVRDYLLQVQADVAELVRSGNDQMTISSTLAPRYLALHPDWSNGSFMPSEIATFYAEAVDTAPPPSPSQDESRPEMR